ncbi:MAG: DUF262 domain-containing protein [Bacteroidetes bacterium]|nr:DUF262 domain-containing protein [Bacteroidota bacterium]
MADQNPNFRLKAVAELLDGTHHFYIPSYQRGYRWGTRQVEDLIKDIWDFAKNAEQGDFYCLQPLVVKRKSWQDISNKIINGWEVIDGQQRLTSILLLLKYLKQKSSDVDSLPKFLYSITYQTRFNLDFDNIHKESDIDCFHAALTKEKIEKWFSENQVRKSKIEEVLFYDYQKNENDQEIKMEPQVNFIWYVAETENDIESIKIFNNLNKGKIRLTNAELIKALFILKSKDKREKLNLNELAYDWNHMENSLHDDKFWYFLANKNYQPATRIDLIFDFLTSKSEKYDSDFSYRKFQNLYDNPNDPFWRDKDISNFTDAWGKIKEVFETLLYWFEDGTLYHYIGYLIYFEIPLLEIFKTCSGKSKTQIVKEIQILIRNKVLNDIDDINDISGLNHTDNYYQCKKLLLFFNIETCVTQQRNQTENLFKLSVGDTLTYYKFPFDQCKLYDWDIEHVCSKTDNPLREVKDKIIWLSYIENIVCYDKSWIKLKEESKDLIKYLIEKKKDEGNKFDPLYKSILYVVQNDSEEKEEKNGIKDTLDNLVLLDSGTNRGYGNALFPTKRQIIIEKDKEGIFIPVCTKNLFLKYYTKDDTDSSQWKNSWTIDDRKAYMKAIHDTIDFILM